MISVPAHFISTTKRGSQREQLLEASFHFVQKRQVRAMGCSPHCANIGGDDGQQCLSRCSGVLLNKFLSLRG
jgi:hypothetical protein